MPRFIVLIALILFCTSGWSQTPGTFSQFFLETTLRVDYYHTGTAGEEYFSLDQAYEEGAWPGSRINLVDTLNLGECLVKVFDLKTNQLIYSRGYSTVFGEWRTTEEAVDGKYRTFHETVRCPFPKRTVQVVIASRDRNNVFIDKFSTVIEPASRFINRELKKYPYSVRPFLKNGTVDQKIDLVILGDGYSAKDLAKFRTDVKHYTDVLFNSMPFSRHKIDFNVWMIETVSADSGIDDPRNKQWRHTLFDASYNAFDSQRYILTFSNKELRNVSALAPYDYIYILVNSAQYGGGGIFNCYATCYTGVQNAEPAWWSDYVFVHEFGHAFAGLADEYYTSSVSYQDFYPKSAEPWEPNITTLLDRKHPKWTEWIAPNITVPTPWAKAEYDSLSAALQKLSANHPDYRNQADGLRTQMEEILGRNKSVVGCYEGAGYASQGVYRPALDCRMFSKSLVAFCPVCQQAIEKMIAFCAK
jgi:hypothetical protein